MTPAKVLTHKSGWRSAANRRYWWLEG